MKELLTNEIFWFGVAVLLSFVTGKFHLVGKAQTFLKNRSKAKDTTPE